MIKKITIWLKIPVLTKAVATILSAEKSLIIFSRSPLNKIRRCHIHRCWNASTRQKLSQMLKRRLELWSLAWQPPPPKLHQPSPPPPDMTVMLSTCKVNVIWYDTFCLAVDIKACKHFVVDTWNKVYDPENEHNMGPLNRILLFNEACIKKNITSVSNSEINLKTPH